MCVCVCVLKKKVGEGLIFICFCEHCEREECDIVLLVFFAGSCLPWKLLLARMVPPVCQSSCRLLLGDMDYAI